MAQTLGEINLPKPGRAPHAPRTLFRSIQLGERRILVEDKSRATFNVEGKRLSMIAYETATKFDIYGVTFYSAEVCLAGFSLAYISGAVIPSLCFALSEDLCCKMNV